MNQLRAGITLGDHSRPTFSMSSQNSAATSPDTVALVAEIAAT